MLMNMRSPALTGLPGPIARRGFGLLGDLLMAWTERRRSRRDLAQLDARLLRDIGLSLDEATREAAVPFWRR